MNTAARTRVVQDIALGWGVGAADVALLGGLLVAPLDLLAEQLRHDAVMRAALREVPVETQRIQSDWIVEWWDPIGVSAAALDVLDQLDDPFPAIPPGAAAHRHAAQELALAAGDCCAAVAWAGGAAVAQWLRLYAGYKVSDEELCAADPVLEAARRELSREQLLNVTAWVHRNWVEIDELASSAEAAA